ncbi:NUDIX domain-containing protein [Candidatus Micrarchaeota archaeon]|nr:NUDIX domain-containing protein [Candidatus Micrarchaeota archaeon]MBU1930431.1 NUDIX domain-containing protein [Candidatus Micrarchaeota archaeon]
MNTILSLDDLAVGWEQKPVEKWVERTAARAVLFKKDKIALLRVTKQGYHKLPGGGVDKGETILQGLERELLEETGCTAKVLSEIGIIVEHRSHLGILQTSHCFLAEVVSIGQSHFEPDELEDGFELKWFSLENAIKQLKKDIPKTYDGRFIVKRDLAFLKKAGEL